MDNPLKQPCPQDPIQRVHDYARDLAYLFVKGDLEPQIVLGGRFSWTDNPYIERDNDSADRIDFRSKWAGATPQFDLLTAYGYLNMRTESHIDPNGKPGTLMVYVLTPKAMQLLEKPIRPPSVFISYRRKDSSALALLIEARLRIAGIDPVFIDKNITAGDEWREHIAERIRDSRHFVLLVGPGTLSSSVVQDEIALAVSAGCRILSIWHGGATMAGAGDQCPEALKKLHAITVTGESAREYETAISELLNSLGYRTY